MGLLSRWFGRGRLARDPSRQTAGKVLPPASVQRSHLGLRAIEPDVLVLRTGELRAVLRVDGYPLHQRSLDDALVFLRAFAAALNALPQSGATFIGHTRGGGLDEQLAMRETQATALATRQPGTGLAKLAADQLAHARRLQRRGHVRTADDYLVVRAPAGQYEELARRVTTIVGHFTHAGLRVHRVKDAALAQAVAESWRPERGGTEHRSFPWAAADGTPSFSLVWDEGIGAKLVGPKPLPGADAGTGARGGTLPARSSRPSRPSLPTPPEAPQGARERLPW